MKLQVFNGGKSSRLAKHLIGVNEGVEFSNVDISSGELKPLNKHSSTALNIDNFAHYFIAASKWVSSAIDRDYVEYQEKLYFTEATGVPKVDSGFAVTTLGIKNPLAVPSATLQAGTLTGTYDYVYTFYNNSDGTESGVSPILSDIVVANNLVLLANLEVSEDTQVTHKRIYRVGGNLTTFSLVATIVNSDSSYSDNLTDTGIDGRLLDTLGHNQAKFGAKFLTEVHSIMFYALGDKLYYTPIGKPWAWPEEFFIDFPLNITGIGVVNTGLLVFTQLETYIVTGNTPATLSKYPLSRTQGCKSHKSIARVGKTLFWYSNDGLCASVGDTPKVVSRDKLGDLELIPIVAVVHNEVYYLQHNTGVLVHDLRYKPVYIDLDLGSSYLVVGNDKLYGRLGEVYNELFKGSTKLSMVYKSPQFIEGSFTERKNYKTFYIRSLGDLQVDILITGKVVQAFSLSGEEKTHDLDIPSRLKNGYSAELHISGVGTVKEIKFEPYGVTR